ncbi:hypothetical protein POM88_037050 [Heracleum sosnowskyi]|uniref:Small auxin up regulated protein n=1 Tax=Heracleum sosnowskyi TaxID=360622 RepID=A0AAD8HQE9_9APIA|nr:hypothetical protein POM88_037050 [Heracleum sosnowskyi]
MAKFFGKLLGFSRKIIGNGHRGSRYSGIENSNRRVTVPSGCFPIYVGEEHRRYVIPVKRLSSTRLQALLDQFKEEIADSEDPITLPCSPVMFEHVLGLPNHDNSSILSKP